MTIELIKVRPDDIQINKPLPFSIYTADQSLLLKIGTVVASEKQLTVLLEKGVYRNLTEQEIEQREAQNRELDSEKLQTDPFATITHCVDTLDPLLQAIAEQTEQAAESRIVKLADLLRTVIVFDPNAALGAIHLLGCSNRYATTHSIYTAVLSGILGRRRQLADDEITVLIAAALTMNVGMLALQNQLYEQATPLTEEQRRSIAAHPTQSALLLKQAGIASSNWQEIVRQHHEKNDGSGYPDRLSENSICEGAKIVALADVYTSLISGRKHRAPILAHDAIKSLFAKRGGEIDEMLASQFIREIGVYPPGTFVGLENGEIALVTKRAVMKNNKPIGPYAMSLFSPRGAAYREPQKRDCGVPVFKISQSRPPLKGFASANAKKFWGY
ncbi:MAG: hypothetical protein Kow0065_14190 [Methylomicrobium sp.]